MDFYSKLSKQFSELAGGAANLMGSAPAFIIATAACILWAISGPIFHYSDTWQLVINTATTVLTFLAVFLIQHSQNRDGRAIQLKLDELIRSTKAASNRLIDLEHGTEEEFDDLQSAIKQSKEGSERNPR
ncbi:low affinity iron permease family protein [Hyphomicrobium facile]|uniref:Low affinity Fe/Cu permease n=1 Tax=Hyphomicrobium facile TaxID=51670 RepID=A0A1I7NHH3_9HYPH|nr:Low affinity Fe/Cu permease [Hyphomicrobium facile]